MDKLEKVIEGLWRCELIHRGATLEESCNVCPYQRKPGETCEATELFFDARQILKAQEPVMVEERADTNTINCPKCGQQFARVGRDKSIYLDVDEDPNYCWNCGQAVKWE